MPLRADLLDALNKSIKKDMQAEERQQGHYLSGNTEKSFENDKTRSNGDVILDGYAAGHIEFLEEGVPASRIPYDPNVRTGAKHSKYIDALQKYSMLRFGIGEEEGLRAAFAIARKHKAEGMPTKGSYAFSQTGKRLEALADSFTKNEDRYFGTLDDIVEEQLDKGVFE